MQNTNLTGHLLIAAPTMTDAYFEKSLIFICQHNKTGAVGVIINRPMPEVTVSSLSMQYAVTPHRAILDQPVYSGGPIQPAHSVVVHQPIGAWQLSFPIDRQTALTFSPDVIDSAVHNHTPPSKILVFLGYSGWAAGQLEDEISQNDWLTVPSDAHILFDVPSGQKLEASMKRLGINPGMLISVAGHA